MSESIHLNLSADSPDEMRKVFELCMAETNELHYDGKLVIGPDVPGSGQVYVFGDECPDCEARQWRDCDQCMMCQGRKEIQPSWVTS